MSSDKDMPDVELSMADQATIIKQKRGIMKGTTPAGSPEGVISGHFVRVMQPTRLSKKQSDRLLLNNLARVAHFEWAAEIRGSKGKGQQLKRKRGLPRMSRRSFTFSTVASLDERGRQRYSFAIARSGSRI